MAGRMAKAPERALRWRELIDALRWIPWRRWLRQFRRSPVAWWATALVLSLVATGHFRSMERETLALREQWGQATTVWVAARPLAIGEVVVPADVVETTWPNAVVPQGALAEWSDGLTVSVAIGAGEALVIHRLAPSGVSPVAARIPAGYRAVALPIDTAGFGSSGQAPPLQIGDRVDVLMAVEPSGLPEYGNPTGALPIAEDGVVAAAALVVEVADGTVTVAVSSSEAAGLAQAANRGPLTLALLGPSPGGAGNTTPRSSDNDPP